MRQEILSLERRGGNLIYTGAGGPEHRGRKKDSMNPIRPVGHAGGEMITKSYGRSRPQGRAGAGSDPWY